MSITNRFKNYALAMIIVAAAFLAYEIITHLTGQNLPPFITFFPAIMLAALIGGLGPGLFATMLAALVVDYFIFLPTGTFKIANAADLIAIIIFCGAGILMSTVAQLYRNLRDRLEETVDERTAELRQSEQRLSQTIAATKLGSWDYNPVTGSLKWDNRCKELFGLPPDAEVDYDTFLASLHPDDRDNTDKVVKRSLDPASGGFYDIEYRTVGLRDGGVLRWVRATGQVAFNDAGQAVSFIGTVQDITEKKKAEESLRKLNAELERRVGEQVAQIRKTNETLEQRIAERTAELQAANETLRTSRLAALNLMEDAIEARKHEEQAKEKTLESERFIKSVAEASPQWFYVFDLDSMGITYANRPILRDLGYPEDVQAVTDLDTFSRFMPEDEMPHLARLLDEWRTLPDGRVRGDEYCLRHADGSLHYFEGREIVFARHPDGKVKQVLGLLLDITDRKHAEQALKESQMDLARAQAVALIGSWRLDIRQNKLIWSDEAYRIFGVPTGTSMTYESFLARVHSEDRQSVERKWNAALAGEPYDIEHRITSNGQVKWVREKAELEFDKDDNLIGGFGTVQDITARKQAEEALAVSESRYRRLFEAAHDGILILDSDSGQIVDVNPFMKDLLGYSHEELLNKKLWEIGPFKDIAASKESFLELQNKGFVRYENLPLETKDGRRMAVEFVSNVYLVDHKKVIQCNIRDITDRVRAEQALRESQHDLGRAQEVAHTGSWRLDVRKNELAWSDENYRIFGAQPGSPQTYETFLSAIHPDDRDFVDKKWKASLEGEPYDIEHRIVVDGKVKWVRELAELEFDEAGSLIGGFGITQDITAQKQAQKERETTIEFLRIVNGSTSTRQLVRAAAVFFQKQSGCEAVGLRLKEGDDFPYYEARGFSKEFVQVENSLCAKDLKGQLLRDDIGNPILDCMCGNIIQGRFDPSKPFFTKRGSFWTNCTTELLATTTEKDRQSRTRNRCNGAGYESVALIGLRVGQESLGLLQLNDKRKNQFTPETIAFWERLADHLAVAIAKFHAEEDLRKLTEELEHRVKERTAELAHTVDTLQEEVTRRIAAEETTKAERKRFENVLEMMPAYAVLLTPDYHVAYANHTFREWFGDDNGKKCYEFLFQRTEPCENCQTYNVMKTGKSQFWEWTGPNGNNYDIYDYPFTDTDGSPLIMEIGLDVTAHKKAQKALQETSLYARSLLEASLDPLVTISPDGKITDVNEATIKVTGASRKKLIGADFSDYFTEPEKAREGYQQVFAKGFVTDYPLTIRGKDGQLTDVLYNATVYKNQAGQIQGVFAAARDVTEHKKTQKAVQTSEERYRGLTVATTQIVWTTAADGQVVGDMPSWREFTGQTLEEIQGWGWINSLHPDDRDRTAAIWSEAIRTSSLYQIEYRIRRRDGEYRHVATRGVPVLEEDQCTIREWIGTCTDITERKLAQQRQAVTSALLELFARKSSRKEYLDSTVEAIRQWSDCEFIGVRVRDNEGNIPYESYVNFDKEFLALENDLNLDRDSCVCIRAMCKKTYHDEKKYVTDGGSFYVNDSKAFADSLTDKQLKEYRGNCIKKGFLSIAVVPVRYQDEVLGAIHLADFKKDMLLLPKIQFIESTIAPLIGEALQRFNAEAELDKYRVHLEELVAHRTQELEKEVVHRKLIAEDLTRSNKDLEQFAYVASHDLQEPLRAVAGFVELLSMKLEKTLDNKSTEYINHTVEGVKRMQSLINGLLEYSRIGSRGQQPAPADAKTALDRALAHLHMSITESGAKITVDDLPKVNVDALQLAQLFQNLISNAIKFRSEKPPKIRITANHKDGFWQFAVADNGIGIEPQYMDRIFLIFQRLHSRVKYPGTGIGLALCKKIVERHGGKIWVESKAGAGSTFYFTIPDTGEAT